MAGPQKSRVLTFFLSLGLVLLLTTAAQAQKAKASDLLGDWLIEAKDATVKIAYDGKHYNGTITWLATPLNEAGKPKLDKNNPAASQRTKPILGLMLLKGFVWDGEEAWEDGTIYDARTGKTYSCVLTMEKPGVLKVRGYIGSPIFGKTQYWTKK